MAGFNISAVAFEEDGVWVVQGIEFDICAHAKDAAGVPAAFMRAVAENISISQHLGRKPLQGVRPSPARYKAMFDGAVTEVRPVRTSRTREMPIASVDIRLAEHA